MSIENNERCIRCGSKAKVEGSRRFRFCSECHLAVDRDKGGYHLEYMEDPNTEVDRWKVVPDGCLLIMGEES